MTLRLARTARLHFGDARSLARIFVALVLLTATLAGGGALAEVNVVVAAGGLIVLGLTVLGTRGNRGLEGGWMAAVVGLALAAVLVQLAPMPLRWLAALSPGAHAVYDVALRDPGAWVRASLDWPATAHEALKLCALFSIAVAAPSLFATPRRLRELLLFVTAAGLGVLAIGLGNAFVDPRALDPHGGGMHTSFLNPNHAASFLGFSSFAALAAAFSAADGRKWLLFMASALLAGGVALTMSRAGIAAFVLVFVLFLALAIARGLLARRLLLVLAAVVATGGTVAMYAGADSLATELLSLRTPGFNKAELWRVVPPMLRDHWFFGIGRGAFASVYDRYDATSFDLVFSHLENEPLQTLVDFGVIAGGLLLLGLAVAFARAVRRGLTDATKLAAAAGLAFVGLHNCIDFGLFLTGISLPATALLAVLARSGGDAGRRPTAQLLAALQDLPARRWLPALALCSCLVIVSAVARPAVRYRGDDDARRLRLLFDARDSLDDEVEAAVRTLVLRHPADYLLPLIAAEEALRDGVPNKSISAWINHALFVAPRRAVTHRMAGVMLMRTGHRAQALVEYRLALGLAPNLAGALVDELLASGGTWADVAALRPEAPATRTALAQRLADRQQHAHALSLLDDLVAAEPTDRGAVALAARCELALGHLDRAQALAARLEAAAPDETAAYLMQSDVASRAGRVDAAIAVLERAIGRVGEAEELLRAKLNLHLRLRQHDAARRIATLMLQRARDASRASEAHATLAEIHREEGELAQAIRAMQKARELQPDNLGVRLRIARLREEMGDLAGAATELRRARDELGVSPALTLELERLEQRSAQRDDALRRELLLSPR